MVLRISFILLLIQFSIRLSGTIIENLLPVDSEQNISDSQILKLQSLLDNPLPINKASKNELSHLFWLTRTQINKIIQYRKDNIISSSTNLREIGLSEEIIEQTEPFIAYKRQPLEFTTNQQTRVEIFAKNKAANHPLRYLQKTQLNLENIELGFISQKDETESDLLDYTSYYGMYRNQKILRKFILGYYRLSLGQGLLFTSKLGFSKGSAATSIPIKKYSYLRPYTSTYELWYLRGIAANFTYKNFTFIPFFSIAPLSANLEDEQITSFNETGIHTDSSDKNNVKEQLIGGSCSYNYAASQISVNFYKQNFDHDFADASKDDSTLAVSTDFYSEFAQFTTFGEFALANAKKGGLCGLKWGDDTIEHLIIAQYYEDNFPTWHGNPFSEQNNFDNELGLYYGIQLSLNSHLKIKGYFDVWNYPETRYFEKMPTAGNDELIQLDYKVKSDKFRILLKHKQKDKYISLNETAKIRKYERATIRFDWWKNHHNFTLKTRFEYSSEYLPDDDLFEKGILTYEQLKFKHDYFNVVCRLTAYQSDILLYTYENNVSGIIQSVINSGEGLDGFILVKTNLYKNIELQAKYSESLTESNSAKLYLQLISEF